MESAQPQPISVGVIGLGPRWVGAYRSALAAEASRFRVRAVCDPAYHNALEVAKALGCEVAEGPTDLMETPELDAVLVLDAAWYGWWPLEVAARLQMPVFCDAVVDSDPERGERVLQLIEEAELPVQFGFAPRYMPATRRLWLMSNPHGKLRGIRLFVTGASGPERAAWLNWCMCIIDSTAYDYPEKVTACRIENYETIQLFSWGKFALIQFEMGGVAKARAEIVGDRGSFHIRFPAELRYRRGHARVRERWDDQHSSERRMLRDFHGLVMEGDEPEYGFRAARGILDLCRRIDDEIKEQARQFERGY